MIDSALNYILEKVAWNPILEKIFSWTIRILVQVQMKKAFVIMQYAKKDRDRFQSHKPWIPGQTVFKPPQFSWDQREKIELGTAKHLDPADE